MPPILGMDMGHEKCIYNQMSFYISAKKSKESSVSMNFACRLSAQRFGLFIIMMALISMLAGCGGSRGGSDGILAGSSEPPPGGGGGGGGRPGDPFPGG